MDKVIASDVAERVKERDLLHETNRILVADTEVCYGEWVAPIW